MKTTVVIGRLAARLALCAHRYQRSGGRSGTWASDRIDNVGGFLFVHGRPLGQRTHGAAQLLGDLVAVLIEGLCNQEGLPIPAAATRLAQLAQQALCRRLRACAAGAHQQFAVRCKRSRPNPIRRQRCRRHC